MTMTPDFCAAWGSDDNCSIDKPAFEYDGGSTPELRSPKRSQKLSDDEVLGSQTSAKSAKRSRNNENRQKRKAFSRSGSDDFFADAQVPSPDVPTHPDPMRMQSPIGCSQDSGAAFGASQESVNSCDDVALMQSLAESLIEYN